jgi:GAF domain-containing protein
LLNLAVNLIRDRFSFYHAGIFLIDERGEYAVLKAATGEAGRQMLARGHKLRVGEVGIVGAATGSGRHHIAQDVGADTAHFKNPLLPYTRSELALPLQAGSRVIGALDVQSMQATAFQEEDVTVLQTIADQLAVAIENARLIRRMNETVQELEQAYGRFTTQAWSDYAHSTRLSGLRFQQLEVEPVSERNPEANAAITVGQTVVVNAIDDVNSLFEASPGGSQPVSALAVPIKLRNQTIGVIDLRFNAESVSPGTIQVVEEATSRLALVLENARLLQEAQRLAAREQQINMIATQVRGSIDIEAVLQTTVRELGKALGADRTFIHIGFDPDSPGQAGGLKTNGGNGGGNSGNQA